METEETQTEKDRKINQALTSVAQLGVYCPVHNIVLLPVQFLVKAYAQVVGSIPSRGSAGGSQSDVSLSH